MHRIKANKSEINFGKYPLWGKNQLWLGPNHILSTIFEIFFCLVLFFMLLKKLSTFKIFLKIPSNFFQKKPNFEKQTCQKLDSFIFSSPNYSIFLSKERQSFICLWNQLKENVGHSDFALLNQKNT